MAQAMGRAIAGNYSTPANENMTRSKATPQAGVEKRVPHISLRKNGAPRGQNSFREYQFKAR
jgi:hypothetical protein